MSRLHSAAVPARVIIRARGSLPAALRESATFPPASAINCAAFMRVCSYVIVVVAQGDRWNERRISSSSGQQHRSDIAPRTSVFARRRVNNTNCASSHSFIPTSSCGRSTRFHSGDISPVNYGRGRARAARDIRKHRIKFTRRLRSRAERRGPVSGGIE